MSRLPKIDKKPKNNKSTKFRWVDSQWEKFMTEQKELKKQILQLEIENAELRDRLYELGEDPNQMKLFK
jgi:predicted RNase H-like nuclease (RuvC/YqgF family)